MRLQYLLVLPILLLGGCFTTPRGDINVFVSDPIDPSRLVVTQDLHYRDASIGYHFPAGEYRPVAKDANGTFYQSPTGVTVRLGITQFSRYDIGGIYVTHDEAGRQKFLPWYGGPSLRSVDIPLRGHGPDPDKFIVLHL